MTIFFELVKVIIIEKLQAEMLRSTQEDDGLVNRGISFFSARSAGRNPKVSAAKRNFTQTAITEVINYEPVNDDQQNFRSLDVIIETCRNNARNEAKTVGLGKGKHFKSMNTIQLLLKDVYNKFAKLKLLNVPLDQPYEFILIARNDEMDLDELKKLLDEHQKPILFFNNDKINLYGFSGKQELIELDQEHFAHLKLPDKGHVMQLKYTQMTKEMRDDISSKAGTIPRDPYVIFRYHLGSYLVKILDHDYYKNNDNQGLSKQKEDLVLGALASCEDELERIDNRRPDYNRCRKDTILTRLGSLQCANMKACDGYKTSFDLPVTNDYLTRVNIPLGEYRPSEGCLENCICNAAREIDSEFDLEDFVKTMGNSNRAGMRV